MPTDNAIRALIIGPETLGLGSGAGIAGSRWRRRGYCLASGTGEQQRAEAARVLRRQVLAAAIAPIPNDMRTTAQLRSGVLQSPPGSHVEATPHKA